VTAKKAGGAVHRDITYWKMLYLDTGGRY